MTSPCSSSPRAGRPAASSRRSGADVEINGIKFKKGRKVERVSMMWLPKTSSGRRDAQNLIDQHSIVRRAKLRGGIPEMPVLVDFSLPAAER